MSKCPHCGLETNPVTHTAHTDECKETLCMVCFHCEFSNGDKAERCICRACSCFDINFVGVRNV